MDRTDEHDPAALAQALLRDEANRRSMFEWADRSWLADLSTLDQTVCAAALTACGPRWLELIGASPLPLRSLRGHALLLMALPIEGALKMLRLRALWPRRAELRHWIDRPRRMRLATCVGAAAAEALRRDGASALGTPAWLAQAAAPETMSDDELAWEGYCLFESDGLWPDDGTLALPRVALPRVASVPPWIAQRLDAGDAADCAAVLRYIPLISSERA